MPDYEQTNFGLVNSELVSPQGVVLNLTTSVGILESKANSWQLKGTFPTAESTRPTIASSLLSDLLTQTEAPTTFLPYASTIDSQQLSYTSTLVKALAGNVTFLNPPSLAPQSEFNITDALLVNYGQRALSMSISFSSRVALPYDIRQQLLGFSVEKMQLITSDGSLAAVMKRRVIADSQIERRADGSTLFKVTDMEFGLYNAAAFYAATANKTAGNLQTMTLRGILTAQVATQAGLVEVGQLHMDGRLSTHRIVNAQRIP